MIVLMPAGALRGSGRGILNFFSSAKNGFVVQISRGRLPAGMTKVTKRVDTNQAPALHFLILLRKSSAVTLVTQSRLQRVYFSGINQPL